MDGIFASVRDKLSAGESLTIVAYGDSWTYGSVADGWFEARDAGWDRELIHGSWVMQLRRAVTGRDPNAKVINSGQGGWTSLQGSEAYDRLVSAYEPDLLILNFGINDMRHRVPPEEYRHAVKGMLERAHAAGAACLLWASGPLSMEGIETYGWDQPMLSEELPYRFAEYNDTLRSLAAELNLTFVDAERGIQEEWEAGTDISGWFYDAIHFTQEGHDSIYRLIAEALGL